MNYCISKEDIELLQAYVYSQQLELCGYLEEVGFINGSQQLSIMPDSIVQGIKLETRQMCPGYSTSYIFHTHPPSELSAPSIEDVKQVIHNKDIKVSVIATRWGIYIVKRTDDSLLKQLEESGEYDGYINFIKRCLQDLYDYESYYGFPKIHVNPSIDLMNRQLFLLNGAKKQLQFSFHRWEDLLKEEVKVKEVFKKKRKLIEN